jgi:hypothetical protein
MFVGQLLPGNRIYLLSPTTLRVDNQPTIAIVYNPEFHNRKKSIEICFFFVLMGSEISLMYPGCRRTDKDLVCEKHERYAG